MHPDPLGRHWHDQLKNPGIPHGSPFLWCLPLLVFLAATVAFVVTVAVRHALPERPPPPPAAAVRRIRTMGRISSIEAIRSSVQGVSAMDSILSARARVVAAAVAAVPAAGGLGSSDQGGPGASMGGSSRRGVQVRPQRCCLLFLS